MAELLQDLNEKIKALAGDWTKYTVVGGFVLYVLGYLTLRFHLTALGVGTDLTVLDERYLFAGARFLIYVVSSVPIIVLLAFPVVAVLYGIYRLLPTGWRTALGMRWCEPMRVVVIGVVFSVLSIQLVMRQCFYFSNLLLAPQLPQNPPWLVQLLLDDQLMPLYFSGLVAGCAVSIALLLAVRGVSLPSRGFVFAKALLAFLAAVQLLFLPVNYGVLIVDKSLPRVAALGEKPLTPGQDAWLVWEGKDGVTWLVRSKTPGAEQRALVTLPRASVKEIAITGYDRILPILFSQTPGVRP